MTPQPGSREAHIDEVVELMEHTNTNLTDLMREVFVNWEAKHVLALFPDTIINAALVYLRQQREEQAQGEREV